MRERFKFRSEAAGNPRKFFSFHSLRDGLICSALVKAGAGPDTQHAVLERTALIAGWVPFKLAQLEYIKKVARRAIVSSRLINEDEDGENLAIMDDALLGVEAFHGIAFEKKEQKEKVQCEVFKGFVVDRIKKYLKEERVQEAKKKKNRYMCNGSKKHGIG
ncbi:uncharacterized protein MONOS_13464 [Monocercomonoides exilis]|uniref:uncharacterized protein n=1 Tax=Monocercomonoides exilis TaxID=2049356 RepID=UPI00355A8D89|nr:hypothetical protein MONOS_13464 [Monocercomonoides exilis]